MTLHGTRFGTISYASSDQIEFPQGLVGFPQLRRFLLLSHNSESPFRWLQSLQDPAVAFLLAHPASLVPGYSPPIPAEIAPESASIVLVTAAIPHGRPLDLTLNLAAPVVVNPRTRFGIQVVLDDPAYTVKHRVYPEANRGRAAA